jgi:hypothetical protein
MLVPIQINNSRQQWVRLDTGCASALQWVTASVRPEECTRRVAVALTSFSVPVTQTTRALMIGVASRGTLPRSVSPKESTAWKAVGRRKDLRLARSDPRQPQARLRRE